MTEMTSVGNDFANAIELDHLTDDELELVADIFFNYK
jgi:hypothetical protein